MVARKPRTKSTRTEAKQPLLSDGTPYTLEMPVKTRDDQHHGYIVWISWNDTAKHWQAVVAWAGRDVYGSTHPQGQQPLSRLMADPAASPRTER